jgi:hypothetical protein
MKSATTLKYDLIFEKIMDTIPNSIKKDIKLKSVRENMPKTSFLIESTKKFPVKNPGDVDYNAKLVYAAFIKASQGLDAHPEYQTVIESASQIFKKINGPKKINFRIDECYANKDKDILNAIYLLEGKFDKIDNTKNEFDEELPVEDDKSNECICSECGYEDILDIDDVGLCEEKECPKCGHHGMIHSEVLESDNIQVQLHMTQDIKDKFKIVLEQSLIINEDELSNYYSCDKCEIIIKNLINEQNNGVCPECGIKTYPVNKNHKLLTESNTYCPKCLTIIGYSIMEQDCPVCRTIMVGEKKNIIKASTHSIPIDD